MSLPVRAIPVIFFIIFFFWNAVGVIVDVLNWENPAWLEFLALLFVLFQPPISLAHCYTAWPSKGRKKRIHDLAACGGYILRRDSGRKEKRSPIVWGDLFFTRGGQTMENVNNICMLCRRRRRKEKPLPRLDFKAQAYFRKKGLYTDVQLGLCNAQVWIR